MLSPLKSLWYSMFWWWWKSLYVLYLLNRFCLRFPCCSAAAYCRKRGFSSWHASVGLTWQDRWWNEFFSWILVKLQILILWKEEMRWYHWTYCCHYHKIHASHRLLLFVSVVVVYGKKERMKVGLAWWKKITLCKPFGDGYE